jgi:dipeptidyl aminopeptidase/acylaminoacyl peptidase
MTKRLSGILACALALSSGPAHAAERHRFGVHDLDRLEAVSDLQFSPDGMWLAYVVDRVDTKSDENTSDLWMTRWDGQEQVQLTTSPEDDEHPRFSPDGREIAFLSARGDEDATTQVWVLNRSGGEATALTDVDGEVEDFAWSPDGKRLALIVSDPEPPATTGDAETETPIVIDRYHFKQDYTGYLTARHSHLHVFDRASGKTTRLLSGAFDESMPAWSPDGTQILFVSKRDGDPDRNWNWDLFLVEARAGATPRRLTAFAGGDNPPEWGSAPVWSPDGKAIAYVRAGNDQPDDQFYGGPEVALIAAEGGEPRRLTASVDRWMMHPSFSPDGAALYFTLEDDRSVVLARVPSAGGAVERLLAPGRVVSELAVAPDGKLAVIAATGDRPAEVFAVEGGSLRALTKRNAALLETLEPGRVETPDFTSPDGTRVGAMVVKPPDFTAGRRYPTMLWIHGGPVMQDQHAFDPFAQFFAAQGYVVVSPNYRGSSGRGFAFSRAIRADWGHLEVQDVLAAVDGLVAQGVADPQRLVVGGWSYGGMMTNYVIASDTRFKAAASIAGVSNMLASYGTDQYVEWYEQELGLPWKGIDAYLKVSYPFFHADRIKTPTVFLCGEKDWNVPLINSEQMYQALRSLGVDTRLVVYPGAHHGIDAPSYQRDILERMLAWYAQHLEAAAAPAAKAAGR